jgi:PIN domain nuclease of toxin-antitoxin system
MKGLLDTHVFLWLISGDLRLPSQFRSATQDGGNELLLSVVSLWEAIVTYQLGKMPLPEAPETCLP